MRPIYQALGCVLLGILLISMGLSPRILERLGDAVGEFVETWWPWFSKPRDLRIGFRQSRWLIVLGAAYIVAAAAAYYSQ
jgi:hypothetical protein